MTLEFNDFFVQAFARVMAQRLRPGPRYLVTAAFHPMTTLEWGAMEDERPMTSFASCFAVIDDFGSLVQVTPWK